MFWAHAMRVVLSFVFLALNLVRAFVILRFATGGSSQPAGQKKKKKGKPNRQTRNSKEAFSVAASPRSPFFHLPPTKLQTPHFSSFAFAAQSPSLLHTFFVRFVRVFAGSLGFVCEYNIYLFCLLPVPSIHFFFSIHTCIHLPTLSLLYIPRCKWSTWTTLSANTWSSRHSTPSTTTRMAPSTQEISSSSTLTPSPPLNQAMLSWMR